MPPIYYLNPPPNPFWDFVAGMEDHPFFAGPPRRPHRHFAPPQQPPSSAPAFASAPTAASESIPEPQPEKSEKSRGKQPFVEDPPEVDPSTIKPASRVSEENKGKDIPFRGRGRFAHAFDNDEGVNPRGRGAHPCRGRGRAGWHGQPPFMTGHPFFARPPWAQPEQPDHQGPPGPPPHGPHHRPHGPPPHARGPHGHGPHHRRPSPGFDLADFLNKLGNKLGIDLSNAAEGLGLTADRFTAGKTSGDVDFEPRTDIFENKDLYTIHLSLPGAKKSDIGVDYDGENSVMRITGVVHRPDVDEQMLSELVVDGRKRETGVFEKAIRLGTKRDPANIDVAGITAKMTDGVLVVKVPKVEKVHHMREVPISSDPITEGQADYEDEYSEKPVLFDAEEQTSVARTEAVEEQKREEISLIDMKDSEIRSTPDVEQEKKEAVEESKPVGKQEDAVEEAEKAHSRPDQEQLPAYSAEADHEEDDWEKFSSASGEGEYIKINVD